VEYLLAQGPAAFHYRGPQKINNVVDSKRNCIYLALNSISDIQFKAIAVFIHKIDLIIISQ
jgi:hypothetical protein